MDFDTKADKMESLISLALFIDLVFSPHEPVKVYSREH